jgi:PIN domain nuclease of toxin-antitoxin system
MCSPIPKHQFDRLIVARAIVEQVSLVSADANLDAYGTARIW